MTLNDYLFELNLSIPFKFKIWTTGQSKYW
jgi:hypothetical protein